MCFSLHKIGKLLNIVIVYWKNRKLRNRNFIHQVTSSNTNALVLRLFQFHRFETSPQATVGHGDQARRLLAFPRYSSLDIPNAIFGVMDFPCSRHNFMRSSRCSSSFWAFHKCAPMEFYVLCCLRDGYVSAPPGYALSWKQKDRQELGNWKGLVTTLLF